MKKIKIVFAILAAAAGTSGAIASNRPSSAPAAVHNWLNWDDQVVLVNRTQEQAQLACSGTWGVCLRAQDNTSIYTVGEYTMGRKK